MPRRAAAILACTNLLKALLGLTDCDGDLSVLGFDPFKQRKELMRNICFIADVAVLPGWIKVTQLLDFTEATHPNFSRSHAEEFLSRTKVRPDARVRELSKGMIAQLHLSIIMSIDAKLLVLDEPTLGLDPIFRKEFYSNLLNDYFDGERTILITTHQVEEIENILTDIMFIHDGRILLDSSMDTLAGHYAELVTSGANAETARAMRPPGMPPSRMPAPPDIFSSPQAPTWTASRPATSSPPTVMENLPPFRTNDGGGPSGSAVRRPSRPPCARNAPTASGRRSPPSSRPPASPPASCPG